MADWEAIADCAVSGEALIPSQPDRETSSPLLVDPSPKGTPKRRGRGSFLYQKSYLYSDQPDVGTANGNNSVSKDEVEARNRRLEDEDDDAWNCEYVFLFFVVVF